MTPKIIIISAAVVIALAAVGIWIATEKRISEPKESGTVAQSTPAELPTDIPSSLPTGIATNSANGPSVQEIMVSPTVVPTVTTMPTKGASMPKQYSSPPPMTINPAKKYTATMKTTKGTMTFTLFVKDAPVTVNNFVFLSRQGYYENTPFHRIMKTFMIQGGDPTGTGRGGPGYTFKDEPVTKSYTRGTIAMANAGPNTNGSQFFVMHADYGLSPNYVIFGTIEKDDAESLKTLDAIANSPVTTNEMGEPSKPTELTSVTGITIKEE